MVSTTSTNIVSNFIPPKTQRNNTVSSHPHSTCPPSQVVNSKPSLSVTITVDIYHLLTQQLPFLDGFITSELPFNCIKTSEAAALLPSQNNIKDPPSNNSYFYPVLFLPFIEPVDYISDHYLTQLEKVQKVFPSEDFEP